MDRTERRRPPRRRAERNETTTANPLGRCSGGSFRAAYEYAMGLKQTVRLNAFVACELNDREPEPSAREGLADLRVIEAVFAAAESGRTVPLEPFTRRRRPSIHQVEREPGRNPPRVVHANPPYNN